LAYISAAESIRISSTTFTQSAQKSTEFSKIMQPLGHYAIQGHSRSSSLVPIESPYATSY